MTSSLGLLHENDDDDSDDDEQDEKTEIDPISNIVDSDTAGNRAPVFVEGVSTRRTVPEHAERAAYIGSPVIAIRPGRRRVDLLPWGRFRRANLHS